MTKYDPRFRAPSGAYTRHEWTSSSEIGHVFDGIPLTMEQYLAVEGAYVDVALCMWVESGEPSMRVTDLENYSVSASSKDKGLALTTGSIEEGDVLRERTQIENVIRLNLREQVWCRLESEAGLFFHFGWDYYMYAGGKELSSACVDIAARRGLFVEEFSSPYSAEDDRS